ncbi:MAG: response regulator [Gaiellaceae bacterium]
MPPRSDAERASELAREEVLSEIAHIFRTPLGIITGYVELLRLRDDPELRADALPRIEQAAHRLSHAVDRLVVALDSDHGDLAKRFLDPDGVGPHARRQFGMPHLPRQFHGPTGRHTARVLVVDDDDEIRALLRTLPTGGLEILEARDGREALALLARELPDLVVLDWNTPNATGGDVLAELARQARSVPVIVLTADDEPGRRAAAEAHDPDAFLRKPFTPLELLSEIERLLAAGAGRSFGSYQ